MMNFRKIFQRKSEEALNFIGNAENSIKMAEERIKYIKESKPIDLLLDQLKIVIQENINLHINDVRNRLSGSYDNRELLNKKEDINLLLREIRKEVDNVN